MGRRGRRSGRWGPLDRGNHARRSWVAALWFLDVAEEEARVGICLPSPNQTFTPTHRVALLLAVRESGALGLAYLASSAPVPQIAVSPGHVVPLWLSLPVCVPRPVAKEERSEENQYEPDHKYCTLRATLHARSFSLYSCLSAHLASKLVP